MKLTDLRPLFARRVECGLAFTFGEFRADPALAALDWPDYVIEQFLYEHGGSHQPFEEDYGSIDLERIVWQIEMIRREDFCDMPTGASEAGLIEHIAERPAYYVGIRPERVGYHSLNCCTPMATVRTTPFAMPLSLIRTVRGRSAPTATTAAPPPASPATVRKTILSSTSSPRRSAPSTALGIHNAPSGFCTSTATRGKTDGQRRRESDRSCETCARTGSSSKPTLNGLSTTSFRSRAGNAKGTQQTRIAWRYGGRQATPWGLEDLD
ncbi:hypothetical protein [Streptomyces canus]|uniref:hypothetical protein n=1 Tax=Streptomyces canus TaxID=58343 RepID=UPI002E381DFB|nr:hypothetical protein [Streptomyces canus]